LARSGGLSVSDSTCAIEIVMPALALFGGIVDHVARRKNAVDGCDRATLVISRRHVVCMLR